MKIQRRNIADLVWRVDIAIPLQVDRIADDYFAVLSIENAPLRRLLYHVFVHIFQERIATRESLANGTLIKIRYRMIQMMINVIEMFERNAGLGEKDKVLIIFLAKSVF
jgi:hypothetical protein